MGETTIELIPVFVMGLEYRVPRGLTILKALEYAGYRMTRGCGCRGGVCGACVTIFRTRDDWRLKTGLACQTVVEPGMQLTQLPYTPAQKALYSIGEAGPLDIRVLYPEVMRCLACGTCTKACPMGLDVMGYMAAVIRGDLAQTVELSIECVMCGLCASRCPAELSPFNIALLARRIHGCGLGRSGRFQKRLEDIRNGVYSPELDRLRASDQDGIKERFKEYQATKGAAV